MTGMKLLIALTFFRSGFGAFALARDLGISDNMSLLAALFYSLTSPHILTLFYTGSLTYSLAFALVPFVIYSFRIVMRTRTLRAAVALGVLLGLLIISNETTLYVLFFPLVTYFLVFVSRANVIKSLLTVAAASLIGVLLSAFWLVPYINYDLAGQLNLLSEPSAYGSNVIHWYSFFVPNFGNTIAGDVGWILLLPALASIVFLRKRDEFALYAGAVVVVLLTTGASITPLFYKVPLVLALQFAWRFVIGDVAFLAPMSALFFYRVDRLVATRHPRIRANDKKVNAIFLIAVIVSVSIVALLSPTLYFGNSNRQTPSDPSQRGAFNFLSTQPGYFRVMVIDRFYEAFPEYTFKGSIAGWYDQATTKTYNNYTLNIYYCGGGNRTLEALRLLGARYVMIDYQYRRAAPATLRSFLLSNSPFGPPVYNNSGVTIFEVPNSQLVYVSKSMPNEQYSFSELVNCNNPLPSPPTDDQVRWSISNISWEETSISFDINVNQSSYVLISNAYSPGWVAIDNGSPTSIQVSSPGLPVVHVTKGTHHIVLYYSGAPDAKLGAVLSLVSLGGALVLALVSFLRKKKIKLSKQKSSFKTLGGSSSHTACSLITPKGPIIIKIAPS